MLYGKHNRSGPITICVQAPPRKYPDDGFEVISIEADEWKPQDDILSDHEWVESFIESCGVEYLWGGPNEMRPSRYTKFKICGHMLYSEMWTDWGMDYDEEFVVEKVERYG